MRKVRDEEDEEALGGMGNPRKSVERLPKALELGTGYRSAVNYLEAAKRVHIETGLPFSIQLKYACRTASRSAKRDPSKQRLSACSRWLPSKVPAHLSREARQIPAKLVSSQRGGCFEKLKPAMPR